MRTPSIVGVRVLALAVALCVGARADASALYRVTPLDTADSRLFTNAQINNQGQVYGALTILGSGGAPGGRVPFLYDSQNGGKVSLPGVVSPSGKSVGSINYEGDYRGINDSGQIVGGQFGILRDVPSPGNGIYYQRGELAVSLPGTPMAINNAGQVAGTMTVLQPDGHAETHPYLYADGKVTDLVGPPGANGGIVAGMNGSGQLAVNPQRFVDAPYGRVGVQVPSAYVYDGQKWTDLGTLGGRESTAVAINDRGDVAGTSSPAGSDQQHAFLAPLGGKMIDLGTLAGDKTSLAQGMNNLGQVVGLSFDANSTERYRGFLYDNGTMTDLNTLLTPESGWDVRWGISINDKGQIVALADNGDGQRTILLTPEGMPTPIAPDYPAFPVPEPSTFAIFGLMAGVVRWRFSGRTRAER